MKKAFALLFLLFSLCPGVFSSTLEELVGTANAVALLAGEKPILAQFRNPEPRLIPHHQFSRELIDTVLRELGPGTMVETLHLYEKPSPALAWSTGEKTRLYNNMLALSTLAGLEYFSATRGVMRTFYETSFVIDGPVSAKPLPDPIFPEPQTELKIYARQRDLTFGDNIYQYDYYSAPESLIFIQQNLTPLKYGIITAVAKNNLRSLVAVLDAENFILVYAVSMAKTASLPGMRERVGNSFANRVDAVLNWFRGQADKALTVE